MITIAFHLYEIGIRGTTISTYDYAHYNETILKNKSIILVPKNSDREHSATLRFSRRFEIRFYNDLESSLKDCDILYVLKYGKKDNIISTKIKTVVHCVFDLSEKHGDVYAAVSETLAKKFNTNVYVPHMIGLRPSVTRENLRKYFNIPKEAIVFGRHGGLDTFDLEITKNAIIKLVIESPNHYFIFVNTPVFYRHKNIIHIEKIVDLEEKNKFICSCDAMIHGQSLGETFGISIGEFSVNNIPIIAYGGWVWNDHYKKILGDKAIWYFKENDCYEKLKSFDPNDYKYKDNNLYKKYEPKNVMKIFKKIFIDS